MTNETRDEVAGARRRAEEILTSAGDAITKMLDDIAVETEQLLRSAERDAAQHRIKVEEEAARYAEESNAEADRTRAAAEAVRTEAESLRQAAIAEAAEITSAAASEAAGVRAAASAEAAELRAAADSEAVELRAAATRDAAMIVERARVEHDRLVVRIPELRSALSQFEAQVHALATEPVVDLNEIEAADAAAVVATAPPIEAAEGAAGAPEAAPIPAEEVSAREARAAEPAGSDPGAVAAGSRIMIETIPLPDGSGTLPAAREFVDLDQYRAYKTPARSAPPVKPEEAAAAEPQSAAPPVPAEAAAPPLERLAGTHTTRRGMTTENDTIYQRRGGGLRRRIKAQGDE
jgi:cell division septum initiation protein DivIVA